MDCSLFVQLFNQQENDSYFKGADDWLCKPSFQFDNRKIFKELY